MLDTLTLALDDPTILRIVYAGSFAGAFIVLVSVIGAVITSRRTNLHNDRQAREQTIREIAAYTAEGSLSPDDAERIIRALPAQSADDANAAVDAARNIRND